MGRRNGNAARGGVDVPRKSRTVKGAARREKALLHSDDLDLESLARALGVKFR